MKLCARLTWTLIPLPETQQAEQRFDNMNVVFLASCMGLALNAWEYSITLCDEVDLVWSRSTYGPALKLVKGLFLFSRYFGLIVQSTNVILAQKIASYQSVPIPVCRAWISYQIVVIFSFLSALNLILNFRIYTIYRRSRRIYILLTVVFFLRLILATPVAILYLPRLVFDKTCGFRVPGPIMVAFLIVEMLTQSFALGLTFMRRTGAPNRPMTLLCLLYRDAVVTYIAVLSVLALTTVYGRVESFHVQGYAHFVFPIFVSILSTSACRIVVNLLELALSGARSGSTDSFELTSILEDLDSTEEHT